MIYQTIENNFAAESIILWKSFETESYYWTDLGQHSNSAEREYAKICLFLVIELLYKNVDLVQVTDGSHHKNKARCLGKGQVV